MRRRKKKKEQETRLSFSTDSLEVLPLGVHLLAAQLSPLLRAASDCLWLGRRVGFARMWTAAPDPRTCTVRSSCDAQKDDMEASGPSDCINSNSNREKETSNQEMKGRERKNARKGRK